MAEIKLSRELYDILKKQESELLAAIPTCDKMDACNFDTGAYRAVIQSALNDIQQLEMQFASPPPK